MLKHSNGAKLLFIDGDESSVEIWKCMANVIETLPNFEFFHACDATEALNLIDAISPDVVVLNLDEEHLDERDAFIDSLFGQHPPVVIPLSCEEKRPCEVSDKMIFIDDCVSLDGIHKTLHAAAQAITQIAISAPALNALLH